MKWQDIVATPLFWVLSATGSIILSVIANLLTPRVTALITRRLQSRQSGLREKQIKRRETILTLQANVHRRTAAKIDGIFKLLLATSLLLLCVLLFQISSGTLQTTTVERPLRGLDVPVLLMILLALLAALAIGKLGLDDMSLALTADKREHARDEFVKAHGPASAEEIKQFEDGWDLHEFGVNSKNVPLLANDQVG